MRSWPLSADSVGTTTVPVRWCPGAGEVWARSWSTEERASVGPTLVVDRQRISELRAGGLSFAKIAKEFGCSRLSFTKRSANGSPSALTTWLSAPDETQLPFGCKRNQAADPTDHLKGV
jgi:hypothetical protein